MIKQLNSINTEENIFCFLLYLDQRVVYNFLEQINIDQGKELDREIETAQGKSLDDILTNLKQ
jgi:hypothetical protein